MTTTTTTTTTKAALQARLQQQATVRQARRLRYLERDARVLLRAVGRFSEGYDSAQLVAALGYVSQAAGALQAAALVCERQAGTDDESKAGGGA